MTYSTALIDGSGFAKAAFARGKRALAHRFLLRVFKLNLEHPGIAQTVAWDPADNAAGRRARFPGYKKSRLRELPPGAPTPISLDPEYLGELRDLKRLLPLLGVDQAWAPGWEADDVLATLARSTPASTLVLTRDADLLQLVSDRVHVLLKVGSKETLYTPARAAREGVRVGRALTDWKALAGDPGDDVPGIEGVGPKIATVILDWRPSFVRDLLRGVRSSEFEELSNGDNYARLLGASLALEQLDRLRKQPKGTPAAKAVGRIIANEIPRLEIMYWLVDLHDVPVRFRRGRLDPAAARGAFRAAGLNLLGARLREWERDAS